MERVAQFPIGLSDDEWHYETMRQTKQIGLSPMAKFETDDDKFIVHLVKNTDLLSKFLVSLSDTSSFEFDAFLVFCLQEIYDADEICNETAYGGYGPFDVCVHVYQGVSFVRAIEFDDIGYFLDIEDAKSAALEFAADWPKSNWED